MVALTAHGSSFRLHMNVPLLVQPLLSVRRVDPSTEMSLQRTSRGDGEHCRGLQQVRRQRLLGVQQQAGQGRREARVGAGHEEGDGAARPPGPAAAADAVHIRLDVVGHVEVADELDVVHICMTEACERERSPKYSRARRGRQPAAQRHSRAPPP